MACHSDIGGISPDSIVETINGNKVAKVIIEEVLDGESCYRTSVQSMDDLLSFMFDKSIEFRIIGIQVYRFQDCNYVYFLLMRSKDFTTNIDAEMLDTISRIEFEKGDRND
jgi:hypothetical protein